MRKRKENGGEYQRLLDANQEYRAEIKALQHELKMKDLQIESVYEKLEAVQAAYDKYMFDYSEKRENLEEVIRQYEEAVNKVKDLYKTYEAKVKAEIKEIKKVRKVV